MVFKSGVKIFVGLLVLFAVGRYLLNLKNDVRLYEIRDKVVELYNFSPERGVVVHVEIEDDKISKLDEKNIPVNILLKYGVAVDGKKEDKISSLFDLQVRWFEMTHAEYPVSANKLPEDALPLFADTRLVAERDNIWISNLSGVNGLATFVANKLALSGIRQIETETQAENQEGVCSLVMSKEEINGYVGKLISNIFGTCEQKIENVEAGKIQLQLGKGFSQMVEYQKYVGTF